MISLSKGHRWWQSHRLNSPPIRELTSSTSHSRVLDCSKQAILNFRIFQNFTKKSFRDLNSWSIDRQRIPFYQKPSLRLRTCKAFFEKFLAKSQTNQCSQSLSIRLSIAGNPRHELRNPLKTHRLFGSFTSHWPVASSEQQQSPKELKFWSLESKVWISNKFKVCSRNSILEGYPSNLLSIVPSGTTPSCLVCKEKGLIYI